MSKQNHIEGVIRLTTPMHCAQPGDKIKNATPTMQISIVTGAERTDTMPYFPGNDIRGRLRRKAAAVVMPALVNGKKLPLALYAGLTCGAADNQPENDLTVEEAIRYGKNVYMGLFGGGKRLLRSRFSVQDLVPITQTTIAVGIVPKKFETPDPSREEKLMENAYYLISERTMIHIDDVVRVARPEELSKYLENAAEVVTNYQAAVMTEGVARKAEKNDSSATEATRTKKSSLANMMTIQTIVPGTPMYFRMDFNDSATDAQIGLMLISLNELVVEQALGGWTRTGFGKYNIVEMMLKRNGTSMQVFTVDESEGYRLHDSMAQYTREAQEQVAALSCDDMLSYFAASKAE